MKPDFYRVPGPWSGRFIIIARPRGEDWLADEAKGWREAGVDIVVSLLERDEAAELGLQDEAAAADADAIRFISFPIPDRGVPASESEAAWLIREISDALASGKNVAVHCRQGLGRSGLVAAGVLAVSGMESQDAIDVVSAARGQAVPETSARSLWVRGLRSGPPIIAR